MLQLQEYHFELEYRPGSQNSADYLSRHARPATAQEEEAAEETEEYVRLVMERSRPRPMSLLDIENATKRDDCLQLAAQAILSGDWKELSNPSQQRSEEARERLRKLHSVKDELAVSPEGCIMRGPRLIIPEELTQQAIDLAHSSHQGIVKTKNRLRSKVWFPRLDEKVEQTIKSCNACQVTGPPDPPAPVITEPGPKDPWQCASADFGSLPDGRHMLVVIDDYSKYPEVEIVQSTSAEETIPKIEKIIATHGLIKEIRTDNGPPFTSQEWATYLHSRNTAHRKITPR